MSNTNAIWLRLRTSPGNLRARPWIELFEPTVPLSPLRASVCCALGGDRLAPSANASSSGLWIRFDASCLLHSSSENLYPASRNAVWRPLLGSTSKHPRAKRLIFPTRFFFKSWCSNHSPTDKTGRKDLHCPYHGWFRLRKRRSFFACLAAASAADTVASVRRSFSSKSARFMAASPTPRFQGSVRDLDRQGSTCAIRRCIRL